MKRPDQFWMWLVPYTLLGSVIVAFYGIAMEWLFQPWGNVARWYAVVSAIAFFGSTADMWISKWSAWVTTEAEE